MLTLLLFAVFASVWKSAVALICGGTAALAMALVKAPAGGVAASGTIGGQVYARNRAGNYARAWAKPVNPRTVRQTFVRNSFAANSVAWGMLTQPQIDEWNAYAALLTRFNRLGEAYTPKGRQIFCEVNNNLVISGGAAVDSPSSATDAPGFVLPAPGMSVGETAGAIDNLKTDAPGSVVIPGGGTGTYIIDATPQLDPKITNPQRYFRFVAATAAPDTTFHTEYNAVFGNPTAVPGMNIWLRVRLVDDATGLSSPQQIVFAAMP